MPARRVRPSNLHRALVGAARRPFTAAATLVPGCLGEADNPTEALRAESEGTVRSRGSSTSCASMPKQLFQLAVGTTWGVAPDGEKFLVAYLAPLPDKGSSVSRLVTVANWFDELRLRAPAKKK